MEGSSHRNKISIHPPREGWDVGFQRRGKRDNISIHPPREGWDGLGFMPCPCPVGISIHPPREGWDDRPVDGCRPIGRNFNPPTP